MQHELNKKREGRFEEFWVDSSKGIIKFTSKMKFMSS